MKKGELSKSRIIECAAELFWKNGYHATGINEILTAALLPKGSFYFYFASKKDLAVEVVDYYTDHITLWLKKLSLNKTWEEFIANFVKGLSVEDKNEQHCGCPFAIVGIEIAFSEPEIAAHCANSLEKLKKVCESVLLNSGVQAEDAPMLADRFLADCEGNLLLYRITRDRSKLKAMQADLINRFHEYQELQLLRH